MLIIGLIVAFAVSYMLQQQLITLPVLYTMADALDKIYDGLGNFVRFLFIVSGALIPMSIYAASVIWWIGYAERRGRL